MELLKQNGVKQADFVFKFDEYVDGWEQIVEVNVKKGVPYISAITWREMVNVFEDEEDEYFVPHQLNATKYREFPIGEVADRVSSYVLLSQMDFGKKGKEASNLSYSELLDMAWKYLNVYPKIESKWKDARNALVYVCWYLLELNKYSEIFDTYRDKDLHTRISKRLNISKTNSIQVLNRLKKNGYLVPTSVTNSLVPTVKTVRFLIDVLEPVEFTNDKLQNQIQEILIESDNDVFDYFRKIWEGPHNGYTKTEVHGDYIEEVDRDESEIEAELQEDYTNALDETWFIYAFMSEHNLWCKFNKYLEGLGDDYVIFWKFDENVYKAIQNSDKYINDWHLLADSDLIDEILKELGLGEHLIPDKKENKKSQDDDLFFEEAPF